MAKKKSLAWLNCSEDQLEKEVKNWLGTIRLNNSILFLEGEMGAGKSAFVRTVLAVLAPHVRSQGSPTFPIVQEYQTGDGVPFYHLDLYRLRSPNELFDAGLEAQIEEPGSIACIEWASLFQDSFSYWFDASKKRAKTVYSIRIEASSGQNTRNYFIERV